MTKRKEYPFQMGEWLTVYKVLVRTRNSNLRVWVNIDLPKPVQAMVIGYRTLVNGRMIGGGFRMDDDPAEFVPEMNFTAILVVESIHSKPIYITL